MGQNLYSPDAISPELATCLAQKNLPIGLYNAANQLTGKALEEALARIGLTGVKEDGPIATAGTSIGTTIGCAKELAGNGGPR